MWTNHKEIDIYGVECLKSSGRAHYTVTAGWGLKYPQTNWNDLEKEAALYEWDPK